MREVDAGQHADQVASSLEAAEVAGAQAVPERLAARHHPALGVEEAGEAQQRRIVAHRSSLLAPPERDQTRRPICGGAAGSTSRSRKVTG
ncbi:hypothetical protein ACFQW6_21960 [Nocardioides sp. GCM10028917]|uniref:hypothetical protein n=1 Tax=Nocardioides sp. GCM10028917 TaxID=3273408 RepID=UPI0036199619